MSIPPISSGNSFNPTDSSITTQIPASSREQEVTAAALLCWETPPVIFRRNETICDEGERMKAAACFTRIGVGNPFITSDKISILTCAHLFSDSPQDYVLTFNSRYISFNCSRSNVSVGSNIAVIPLFDLETQERENNSSFEGEIHLHTTR